jgi:hypothetical protein
MVKGFMGRLAVSPPLTHILEFRANLVIVWSYFTRLFKNEHFEAFSVPAANPRTSTPGCEPTDMDSTSGSQIVVQNNNIGGKSRRDRSTPMYASWLSCEGKSHSGLGI